ncbi:hypothetical protein chiPu_0028527, partial [Chiloscyllium punctatum]|nr:hypothetical protein [Chiloscyllium punctatum]
MEDRGSVLRRGRSDGGFRNQEGGAGQSREGDAVPVCEKDKSEGNGGGCNRFEE